MLLSGSSLHSNSAGFRQYDTHRRLEQSAVYGASIAYRYRYTSNNLGLISDPDVQPHQPIELAITGDSFAEGQGGFPWLKTLQQAWRQSLGITSLNYSIAGSGFGDFAVAARNAKRQHQARKVLVLFIEHDAYRPYQTMGSNRACSFYSNGALDRLLGPLACSLYGVVWHHVPSGLSDQDLIRASLARQHYGVLPALNHLIAQRGRPARQPAASTALRFGAIPPASLEAIHTIQRLYGAGNVLLVQLPDKPSETAARLASARQRFAQQLNAATGLRSVDLAQRCRLSRNDFHRLDNHPNADGYRRLLQCVRSDRTISRFVAAAR